MSDLIKLVKLAAALYGTYQAGKTALRLADKLFG
jgi:hypothetical protein